MMNIYNTDKNCEDGNNKNEFTDIMGPRRLSSDLRFAAKDWIPVVRSNYFIPMTREDISKMVLNSKRVQDVMQQLINDGNSEENFNEKAMKILDVMGHSQDIAIIRYFAFILPKIMKKLYTHIYVNENGIGEVVKAIASTPVILVPTHRSYADFLLISYIFYHYDLPVPLVAAGMDFLGMALIGEMFRGAGAFFIRRSFSDDLLYWSVFQEYVTCLIHNSGSPLEFFLEGTRSRSGKSLPPKLGLLSSLCGSWLRGLLPDITFVPISISYNRILEEKLYAYELLGVPKPKESTSGLFKAMNVLQGNYGNIYVKFGNSISCRNFFGSKVPRHLFVDCPVHTAALTVKEKEFCEALGLRILRMLQKGLVISLWSLIASVLLQVLHLGHWSIKCSELSTYMDMIQKTLLKNGFSVDIGESLEEEIFTNLKIHRDLISVEKNVLLIKLVHQGVFTNEDFKKLELPLNVIDKAVTHMVLQQYANQCIHIFIRPALIALSILSWNCYKGLLCSIDKVKERFHFLQSVFSFDFIFEKEEFNNDWMHGLAFLTSFGGIGINYNEIQFSGDRHPFIVLLLDLLKPFVTTYYFCLLSLEKAKLEYRVAIFASTSQIWLINVNEKDLLTLLTN